MKKPAFICLLIAAVALAFFAWHRSRSGFVLVQTYESGGRKWDVTTRIKGDKVRKDVLDKTSTILDMAGGSGIVLNHAVKKFVRIPMSQMVANTKASMQGDAASAPQMTDTGKKEKVNGYDAEIYTAETPAVKFTCWVTKDYPDYAAVNVQLKKYRAMENASGLYPDLSKLDGLVIKYGIVSTAGQSLTATLVSAKIQAVDDGMFQAPADYAEIPLERPGADVQLKEAPPNFTLTGSGLPGGAAAPASVVTGTLNGDGLKPGMAMPSPASLPQP